MFNFVKAYTASEVAYANGRTDKGNGVSTVAGYWMDRIVLYLDVAVMMTNLFNECDLDYFFQKFGKGLVSLSGFLDMLTNFMFRFFSDDDAALYTALSTGLENNDPAAVGLGIGRFIKVFLVVEIPVVTESL